MGSKTGEIKPILWWVVTVKGSLLVKQVNNFLKKEDVKYYILEAKEQHLEKRTGKYFWLDTLVVHNANHKPCSLNENGVSGKITHFDKLGRQLTCYITDLTGVSKTVQFTGDILAITKCIIYMQGLSQHPSFAEYELQTLKEKVKAQKMELIKLKQDLAQQVKEIEQLTRVNIALENENKELHYQLSFPTNG